MTTPNLLIFAGSITFSLVAVGLLAFLTMRSNGPLSRQRRSLDPVAPVLVTIDLNAAAKLEVCVDRQTLDHGGLESLGELIADAARRAGLQDSEAVKHQSDSISETRLFEFRILTISLLGVALIAGIEFTHGHVTYDIGVMFVTAANLVITWRTFGRGDNGADGLFQRAAEEVARWLRTTERRHLE